MICGPDQPLSLCCRYEDGDSSCPIGDPVGLVVTMTPYARMSIVPLGPYTLFNDGGTTFKTQFSLTTFRPGSAVYISINCDASVVTGGMNKCLDIKSCVVSPGKAIALCACACRCMHVCSSGIYA